MKITNTSSASAIYSHNGNPLIFGTDSGTSDTERMRINSSGNVGIGESNPDRLLHLTDSACPRMRFTGNGSDGAGNVYTEIEFENADSSGATFTVDASIKCRSSESNGNGGTLSFFTGVEGTTSERLRIDSSGDIRLSNTNMNIDNSGNSATGLSVTSSGLIHNATADNVTNMVIQKISGSGTETAITFLYGSSGVGTIQYTSSATSFNTSSDYRLKENIVTDWDATTRLKQLKPSRFNFKVDKDTIVDGFLAHEVQAIVPQAVTGTKDEVDENGDAVMQGIDQSKLVPLLVKTIQELEARIAKLEGA
jgi:hypothetical protein